MLFCILQRLIGIFTISSQMHNVVGCFFFCILSSFTPSCNLFSIPWVPKLLRLIETLGDHANFITFVCLKSLVANLENEAVMRCSLRPVGFHLQMLFSFSGCREAETKYF